MSFLILCMLVVTVYGNDAISGDDCFLPGECTNSFHISSDFTSDEYDCLNSCNNEQLCNWFTYFPSNSFCQLLHNCSSVELDHCQDCLSGQVGCVPDPATCWIEGECQGNMIFVSSVGSSDECLQLCKDTFECKWFTYHSVKSPEPTCILFQDCQTLDETCQTCTSGERRCESGSTTTTEISTTTSSSSSGYVAFIVGGNVQKNAELYSPNQDCQHSLGSLPIQDPILVYLNEKILACSGDNNKTCWKYNFENDTWIEHLIIKYYHLDKPGAVYKNKIFIVDDLNPEVYDDITNTWSDWITPLNKIEYGACLLVWRENFLLFGGSSNLKGIQMYDHLTQTWSIINSSFVPMDVQFSGCVVLPNEEILIAGSHDDPFKRSAVLYNVDSDTWTQVEPTKFDRSASSLVRLGNRVFAIDGHGDVPVEEYHVNSKTWSTIEATTMGKRNGHQNVISLPSELFNHLPGGCFGVL